MFELSAINNFSKIEQRFFSYKEAKEKMSYLQDMGYTVIISFRSDLEKMENK